MASFIRNKLTLLGFFLFLGCKICFSQNPQSYFYENEFDLSLPLKNEWSVDIGLGNRGMLQERLEGEKIAGYRHEHLEFNYFTNYKASETIVVSLGLRYRFRELFDSAETDEFRVIEQVELEPANSFFSHRLRLEQRFRENTIHRIRYDVGYSRPISQDWSLGAGTEAIYAISTQLKPQAEQRFSLGLENTCFQNMELQFTVEYRMENYARNLAHEFFFITGVALSL